MADAALALGAYGYLTKPFKRNEVAINVVNALRRRRLEIENREYSNRLQQRYRKLVEQLPAIVYLWGAGADGTCYYVSPGIESVLGYGVEEWLANPQLWVNRLHPSDRDRVVAKELRCRETGERLVCEYRMFARDGRLVWIRDEGVMVRGENDSPHHIQGLMYDVSVEKEAQASLCRSQEETVRRLSRAAEFRDDETGAHIERMSRYCELIAGRLGLDPEHCEQLRIASPMHDVGKIGITDAVLLKPGPLDAEERAQMERHTEIGYRILAGSGAALLDLAATIAWTHQEHFDGSGYPRGLEGEAIPLGGRIAAVADVFDALTNDRVYRPAFSYSEAVEMMQSERGSHFDPQVLDAFLTAESEIKAILNDTQDQRGRGIP
jgi:PAS domain S-box-containing protein